MLNDPNIAKSADCAYLPSLQNAASVKKASLPLFAATSTDVSFGRCQMNELMQDSDSDDSNYA